MAGAAPGAVRIPARFVPRAASDRAGSDWQLQFHPFAAFTAPDEPGDEQATDWQGTGHDATSTSSGTADDAVGDPIAAYLRVNDALARMGFGNHLRHRETTRRDTEVARTDSTREMHLASSVSPSEPGRFVGSERQPRNPTAPVPLLDGKGKPVLDGNGKPILRPAGLDPRLFVQQGLKDRKVVEQLLQNGSDGSGLAALGYELGALRKFRQGGAWDAQRIGGIYHREFIDYATIAIGLYAAAAGIPEEKILEVEDIYAEIKSRFNKRDTFDSVYRVLPERNVQNTRLGYRLYENSFSDAP